MYLLTFFRDNDNIQRTPRSAARNCDRRERELNLGSPEHRRVSQALNVDPIRFELGNTDHMPPSEPEGEDPFHVPPLRPDGSRETVNRMMAAAAAVPDPGPLRIRRQAVAVAGPSHIPAGVPAPSAVQTGGEPTCLDLRAAVAALPLQPVRGRSRRQIQPARVVPASELQAAYANLPPFPADQMQWRQQAPPVPPPSPAPLPPVPPPSPVPLPHVPLVLVGHHSVWQVRVLSYVKNN